MTRIKRTIKAPDGTAVIKHRRGPFLTESATDRGRALVVELQPTHVVLRSLGCRDRLRLDYTRLFLWAARAEAEERRKRKAQERAARRRGVVAAGPTLRRAVRRGVLIR